MSRKKNKSGPTGESESSKKTRVDKHDASLLDDVWQHFRDYLDSCDDEGNGDIDELQEILELLGEVDPVHDLASLKSRKSLLPVLASVAHGNLADAFLSHFLESKEAALEIKIKEHFEESLRLFPFYASIWSILANACRMQIISTTTDDTSKIAAAYEKAADCATAVREHALTTLDQDHTDEILPEWIELLLLNQATGAEWASDDDADDEEEIEDEENSTDGEQEEQDGYWTTSEVECTARFMAAMLLSTLGFHDAAKDHLKFFAVTHRLHPNLWSSTNTKIDDSLSEKVVIFGKEKGNVLPENLYRRLCTVFAPEAQYWNESDYNNRGYYSYFMDINEIEKPSNLIEDVIVRHLLPLAKGELAKHNQQDANICGAEWWVHTRPIQANLGHNLHFDTDEAILSQDKEVTHPILSSVLYLTGGSQGGGATIVLDQTPDSKDVARFAWKNEPRDNSFLLFPGNRLHGVLPCVGQLSPTETKVRFTSDIDASDLFPDTTHSASEPKHRLTFMVGFWTRRVPDRMKERKLYGPCGILPSASEEHTWVHHILEGYDGQHNCKSEVQISATVSPVPTISPAWEALPSVSSQVIALPPRGIDHRFFVKDPPECFYDSLFEPDEFDSIDDDYKET